MEDQLIPPEIKGKNTDLKSSVQLATQEEAEDTFKRACKRMLNPAIWHKLCGPASPEFILTGNDAAAKNRLAMEGDYFRIDLPGPGPSAGDGYDWVRVSLVKDNTASGEDIETFGMKLSACRYPGTEGTNAAHFFKKGATSSFIIRRERNCVSVFYYGRNELPNIATGKIIDNIRNSIVATGALAYLSELQWSVLIKSFLEKEIGG